MNGNGPRLSVVIPVYCSADCLPELVRQLTATLDRLARPYEVILVDDASPDDTWSVLERLAREYPRVAAVSLMLNYGQHRATLFGLSLARGDIVVTMDDDLQQPPDQVPLLLDALASHPEMDAAIGCYPEKNHSWYRNAGSALIRFLNRRAFKLPRGLCSSSFRALRRPVVDSLIRWRTRNPALAALIYQTTRRIINVPVRHEPRFAGRTNYSLYKQLRMALDYVCNVGMLPLHAMAAAGFGFCLFSVAYVIRTVYRYYAQNINVEGWTSLMVMVSLSAGLILLALGVIGEYLVRILREVQGSPRCQERRRAGWLAPPPKDDTGGGI